MNAEYINELVQFVKRIKEDQKNEKWGFEFGRKYDKIVKPLDMRFVTNSEVRYFVERSTGNIYGARSNTTPHLGWYFGNLNRCHLWDWSGHHGVPTNDPDIRPFKTYGPFIHYRLV